MVLSTTRTLSLLKLLIVGLVIAILVVLSFLVRDVFIEKPTAPRTWEEKAIMDAEQAVKSNPQSAEAHTELAAALIIVGRYSEALEHLKIALRIDPQNETAFYLRGVVSKERGRYKQAIDYFLKAIDLYKKREGSIYAEAYLDLARSYVALKKYKQAAQAYEAAWSNTDPQNVNILLELANTYEKMGRKKQAIKYYRGVLAYDPDNTRAKASLKRLGVKPEPPKINP